MFYFPIFVFYQVFLLLHPVQILARDNEKETNCCLFVYHKLSGEKELQRQKKKNLEKIKSIFCDFGMKFLKMNGQRWTHRWMNSQKNELIEIDLSMSWSFHELIFFMSWYFYELIFLWVDLWMSWSFYELISLCVGLPTTWSLDELI